MLIFSNRVVTLLVLWLYSFVLLLLRANSYNPIVRTNIILVGATGNLAQKYLWQSFFDLYLNVGQNDRKQQVQFYGVARLPVDEGQTKLNHILRSKVLYKQSTHHDTKQNFLSSCHYVQLVNLKDYTTFCNRLNQDMQNSSTVESGRIFYLSVPPYAYETIASYINSSCRPHPSDKSWLRVVFEKPFGNDLDSSKQLANTLKQYFNENEIYRVDHYLGKIGVNQILQFRMENSPTYEQLWNKQYISRIEIVMKEEENCAERTMFYNSYGVVRDVMQNHLTEILSLICMELPVNKTTYAVDEYQQLKTNLLRKIKNLQRTNAVIGQYQDYLTHLREDFNDDNKQSNVSTFAAILLQLDSPRWKNVPIVMVSGKELDQRIAYARIVFKDGLFCMDNRAGCSKTEIIFHIQGGSTSMPMEIVSKSLPRPVQRKDWKVVEYTNITNFSYGIRPVDYYIASPRSNPAAYTVVVDAVLHGKQGIFVSTDNLILSWALWTPLIRYLDNTNPRLYSKKDSSQVLQFFYYKDQLTFTSEGSYGCKNRTENIYKLELNRPKNIIDRGFRNQTLTCGMKDSVIEQLVQEIVLSATAAINKNNVFHIAFPGGTTPVPLLQRLALLDSGFPWENCHIWLVDERCVEVLDSRSNFRKLYANLLQHVNIPYYNIHPAIAHLHSNYCDSNYYEREIESIINDVVFDYIVLGVGSDGHVASLFPGHAQLLDENRFVAYVAKGYTDTHRITITLPLLNRARAVSVLILGEEKRDIVQRLKSGIMDVNRYPVTGIKLNDPFSVKWFIDYDALIEKSNT